MTDPQVILNKSINVNPFKWQGTFGKSSRRVVVNLEADTLPKLHDLVRDSKAFHKEVLNLDFLEDVKGGDK